MTRKALVVVSTLTLSACASEIAGPRPSLEGLPDGLEVEFTVEPDEVGQHEPFSAELHVMNVTSDTIRVVTANGCLVVPGVMKGGQRMPFIGSGWACTAAVTTHVFPPHVVRSRVWEMRAALYAQHAGDAEGAPAPKGRYVVQAEFDSYPLGESRRKPAVERELRVR